MTTLISYNQNAWNCCFLDFREAMVSFFSIGNICTDFTLLSSANPELWNPDYYKLWNFLSIRLALKKLQILKQDFRLMMFNLYQTTEKNHNSADHGLSLLFIISQGQPGSVWKRPNAEPVALTDSGEVGLKQNLSSGFDNTRTTEGQEGLTGPFLNSCTKL